MHTLSFDTIYSSFLLLVESYDYVEYTEEELHEEFLSLLRLSLGKPYIRSLFLSVSLDEYVKEMEFEMKMDDEDETEADDFVAYILAKQMAVLWLEPQVRSMTNTKLLLTGKEEKLGQHCPRFAISGNGIVYSFEYAGTPLEP